MNIRCFADIGSSPHNHPETGVTVLRWGHLLVMAARSPDQGHLIGHTASSKTGDGSPFFIL